MIVVKSNMERLPVDDRAQFVLRLPEKSRSGLEMAARANGRSVNAEIIHRMEAFDVITNGMKTSALFAELERRGVVVGKRRDDGTETLAGDGWMSVSNCLDKVPFGKSELYRRISEGQIDSRKFGPIIMVSRPSFDSFLDDLLARKRR